MMFLAISLAGCAQVGQGYVDDVGSVGAQNAVKKAHQMTDLEFVPLDTILANKSREYKPGKKYKGLIYSSVKETNTFVGLDVSFHTFMTAVHNPRSVLYTENVSLPPYHGKNAAAYYGTVCSALVSYALGLNIYLKSYDFPNSDKMILIKDQSSKGIQLADVMWKKGHVALVTGIRREKGTGKVSWIEYCEAVHKGSRRVEKSPEEFDQAIADGKWKIYRYTDLEKNGYTPQTQFVAVEGESQSPFTYNDDLCPNKGDKSCYVTGEKVVLNVLQDGFDEMTVYKDSKVYLKKKINGDSDIELTDLPYGNYKAMLQKGGKKTDFVYWNVVDVQVNVKVEKGTISFHSENAVPVYLEFCSLNGERPDWGKYVFTKKDISNGFVKVSDLPFSNQLNNSKSELYVKVHFANDYGKVINNPILWERK